MGPVLLGSLELLPTDQTRLGSRLVQLLGSLTLLVDAAWPPPLPFSNMTPSAVSFEASSRTSSAIVLLDHPTRAKMFLMSSVFSVPPSRSGGAAVR